MRYIFLGVFFSSTACAEFPKAPYISEWQSTDDFFLRLGSANLPYILKWGKSNFKQASSVIAIPDTINTKSSFSEENQQLKYYFITDTYKISSELRIKYQNYSAFFIKSLTETKLQLEHKAFYFQVDMNKAAFYTIGFQLYDF